ncbi:MAG: DNA-binding protein [Heliobacteriaceae bacterium]|nr:DNA-binding protein [Heliobacteriaceae bacterium]
MDYITARETADKWGITSRMVNYHCAAGRIEGAHKIGNMWVVPKDAEKPEDGRHKRVVKNGK